MDQSNDFYDGIGYNPKTDVGHDGQQFVALNGGSAAESVARGGIPAAPTEMIDERPEDMMAGVFYGFHESVGYKPLWTVHGDAQPFAQGADLYETVAVKAETSVPVGEIAPNRLPKAVYDEFYSGIGYVPRTDKSADAQKFAPKSQLESNDEE